MKPQSRPLLLMAVMAMFLSACDGEGETPSEAGAPDVGALCSEGARQPCVLIDGCRGEQTCVDGAFGACTGPDEACDGVDNDCDGNTDEDFNLGELCSAGLGACARMGTIICQDDGAARCDVQAGSPSDELCNGVDDDCDGAIDNGFDVGADCAVGVGACAAAGRVICDGGSAICDATEGDALPEACNGEDDDCDGRVDEDFPVGEPCADGIGACLRDGRIVCGPEGDAICDAEAAPPGDEICNEADDDCDGATDEGFEVGAGCIRGRGTCARQGRIACDDMGGADCDAVPAPPGVETCNQTDDDCDDAIDEGPTGGRTRVLMCGGPEAVAEAFQPEGLVLESGCAPDGDTQAMLITGLGLGDFDPVGLSAWVDAGGVVITARETSDEVYNALFESNVVQGPVSGDCAGQVNPRQRFSRGDLFWIDNGNLPRLEMRNGCGADLSAYPDIVPLGSHDGEATHLAYADHGAGRLWLNESDWQRDGPLDDPSIRLMRYMVEHGRASVCEVIHAIPPTGETIALSGSIDDADPEWDRPNQNCTDGDENLHPYETFRVTNPAGISQRVRMTARWAGGPDGDGFLHVFEDPFVRPDPASNRDPAGCLAGDDDYLAPGTDSGSAGSLLELDMAPFETVAVVASTFRDDQDVEENRFIGDYEIELETLRPRIPDPGQSIQLSGAIEPGEPLWDRPNDNCTDGDDNLHPYETFTLLNDTGADQRITVTARWAGGPDGDGFLFAFADPFEPADPASSADPAGCIDGDDDYLAPGSDSGREGSQLLDVPVGAGESVVIIATTFRDDEDLAHDMYIGPFTLDIETRLAP